MAWSWKKLGAAKRMLLRRLFVSLVAYEVVFGGTLYLVARMKLEGPVLFLMALLPSLPLVGLMVVIALYLRDEVDEFHRELVVRCLLWGTAAAMTSVCFHFLLQLFGWTGKWPAVIELVLFFAAALVAKQTYRVQNRVPADADGLAGREGTR